MNTAVASLASYVIIVVAVGALAVGLVGWRLKDRETATTRDRYIVEAWSDGIFVPYGLGVGATLVVNGVTGFGWVVIAASLIVLAPVTAYDIRKIRDSS